MGFFYDDLGALETPGAGCGEPGTRVLLPRRRCRSRPQPGLPALMSSPATWALELLRRRSPPGPAPLRAPAVPPRRGTASTARAAPGAPATHRFEPGERGVKASSSPSDSNPCVQETASSDSRDEPALSEVGSGEEGESRLLRGRHACCATLRLRSANA